MHVSKKETNVAESASLQVVEPDMQAMPVEKALEHADEWIKGVPLYEGAQGWRVACATLAAEVRRKMETRQPTRDEMVAGIAKGFAQFLAERSNSWSPLGEEGIRNAIRDGAKDAATAIVSADNQRMKAALERIALNISGDTAAQVIAGEALRPNVEGNRPPRKNDGQG